METTREMTPRKGVKFKCRSERSNVMFTEAPRPEAYESLVSTKIQGQP
jgi:hypothetical protein